MLRQFLLGIGICLFLPLQAVASPPNVAVDIAPVHSLVTQVMQGIGEPDLIIRPGASPHSYSLRPSEAEALSRADVVFWVGEELTPWLAAPLTNLASTANKVALLEVSGITLHNFRDGATFEAHDHHDNEHGHKDEHGHDDDEHAHEDEHGHNNDEHAHEDEHAHGEHDPHAWLDPENAKVWLQVIAKELSRVDADNASTYQGNAENAVAELDKLITAIDERTKELHDIKFIVFHDAYQYFERRFDVQATGAISISDASDPSPARVREIRDTVTDLGVRCVFTEPQYNPEMVKAVFESTRVDTIGVMDPLGAHIATGANHYSELLKALVSSISQCPG